MSEITFCVLPDEYYKKDVYFKLKHESYITKSVLNVIVYLHCYSIININQRNI